MNDLAYWGCADCGQITRMHYPQCIACRMNGKHIFLLDDTDLAAYHLGGMVALRELLRVKHPVWRAWKP